MNTNLISISRRAYRLVNELCEAEVTILSVRFDMDYNTSQPHPFRFYIHAWKDEKFSRWADQYITTEDKQRHETLVRFVNGQVYALYD